MKAIFCTPSLNGPHPAYVRALEESIPLIKGAGWDEGYTQRVGWPYISHARADMTRQALDAKPDVIVYLDYDLSWRPTDLLKLLQTEGDVVAGLYRFKKPDEPEEYMGYLDTDEDGRPTVRSDGALLADRVPAGFLKVTVNALRRLMRAYPELLYGNPDAYAVDLFNHGAHEGAWWGEDFSFCRRWRATGGKIWVVPDLTLTHWAKDVPYEGNFQDFLLKGNQQNERNPSLSEIEVPCDRLACVGA